MKGIILAGGSGTRLWPLSRQQLPKQFLNLDGDESLLEATISRLSPLIEKDDVWVISNEAHAILQDLHAVKRFVEKPDVETAQSYLDSGDYYWNSGMFVWRALTLLEEVKLHLPEVSKVLESMRKAWGAGDS